MATIDFHLHAAGVVAPGISSLDEFRDIARGASSHAHSPVDLPAPAILPAQERRRSRQAVRLVLSCIDQALQASPVAAASLRSVFASDEGTGEVCQQMLDALATTRQVSPLVFSNSVLNAPSGYFSIAWANAEPATVVSMGVESFASGLVCAAADSRASGTPVLMVNYDPPMTAPMNEVIPIADPIASAWIISCDASVGRVLASFAVSLDGRNTAVPSPLPPWMPREWAAQASAQGLAALALVDASVGTEHRLTLGKQVVTLRRCGTA